MATPFNQTEIEHIKELMERRKYQDIWYKYQHKWQNLGFSGGPDDSKFMQYLFRRFGAAETPPAETPAEREPSLPGIALIIGGAKDKDAVAHLKRLMPHLVDLGIVVNTYSVATLDIPKSDFYVTVEDIDAKKLAVADIPPERLRKYVYSYAASSARRSLREEAIAFLFGLYNLIPPKVSIAMPTKNRAWCIDRAIQSILANEYPNIEISIADCASTDNTSEILEAYDEDERVVFHSGPYKNGAEATNAAIQQSTGEYIGYLADDDFYDKNQITRLALFLATHPSTFAVFSDGRMFNTNTGMESYLAFRRPFLDFNTLLEDNHINGQTLMHRNNKEALMGTRDPTGYGEDYLLWLYIAAKYGWAHMTFFAGTHTTGHQDRMTEQFKTEIRRSNLFNRQYALEHWASLRRKNPSDLHIALFSGAYGRSTLGGPAAQQYNFVDALTLAGVDVTVIVDDPAKIDMKNPDRPHRIISLSTFFGNPRYYNVYHVFGGMDIAQRLNKLFRIVPICGSTIVTNCGTKEMVPFGGVFKNDKDWEEARAGDEALMKSANAALWVAQSAFQERTYREICRYDGTVRRLRNAVDTDTCFTFVPMDNRPKKVLWTGHGGRGKGFAEFAVLAKAMPDVKFTVLSASPIPCKERISNITFIIGRGITDMPALLAEGCMLLSTSLCENQPMAILEAMATGLPCVGFASNSGMDEIIIDGENGRIVPFLDIPAIQDAVQELLDNHALRAEMGQRARDFVCKNFSYSAVVEQYLDICGEYLDGIARKNLEAQRAKP